MDGCLEGYLSPLPVPPSQVSLARAHFGANLASSTALLGYHRGRIVQKLRGRGRANTGKNALENLVPLFLGKSDFKYSDSGPLSILLFIRLSLGGGEGGCPLSLASKCLAYLSCCPQGGHLIGQCGKRLTGPGALGSG